MKNLVKLISSDQQQQLLALLINGSDFVSLSTNEGQVNYVNEAGLKMLGLSSLEEAKRPNVDYLVPGELDKLRQDINKNLHEKGRWSGQVTFRHFITGEPIPVHATAMLIYDPETGAPEARATIARDLRPELKIQEEQQKLITLVDNSKDLMSLLNLDGTNSYINVAGRELLGISPEADVSKIPISTFHTEEQLEFVKREILDKVMNTGRWIGEFAAVNVKTGETIPLENSSVRINDPVSGDPVAIGAIMRDLRPELASRKAVQESEARFRNMIMQAPVAIGLLEGKELVLTAANPAMLNIWGKDESIMSLSIGDALPEIRDQGFLELLDSVFESGEAHYGFETLAKLTRNGRLEEGYFNFVYACISETTLSKRSIIMVASEVTAQVLAKKELEESEKRFRSLILEAPMATALYVGRDLIIDVANEAMIKLWGKDRSVIGTPLEKALPELEGQPFVPLLKTVFDTGEAYHTDQQKADLVVDGKLQSFWFNFTYKPIHDADGKVYAILNMAVDITRQVHLQHQKDEFIGIASHELKTPVTSIKAYAQVLEAIFSKKGYLKESEMLRRMGQQINKLTNLIGDLLDVTKIQAGKLMFNERHFDFNVMVHEVVEDMQRTTTRHIIKEDFREVGQLYADPERISQVITNLIGNAIKYSPNADTIIVSTSLKEGQVMLCVKDFGVGIPLDKQERVFEQFYRVSGDKQHTFPGLGLGLYISSEIIKREGGRIWVEAAEGKGSTFCFTIPGNRRPGVEE